MILILNSYLEVISIWYEYLLSGLVMFLGGLVRRLRRICVGCLRLLFAFLWVFWELKLLQVYMFIRLFLLEEMIFCAWMKKKQIRTCNNLLKIFICVKLWEQNDTNLQIILVFHLLNAHPEQPHPKFKTIKYLLLPIPTFTLIMRTFISPNMMLSLFTMLMLMLLSLFFFLDLFVDHWCCLGVHWVYADVIWHIWLGLFLIIIGRCI